MQHYFSSEPLSWDLFDFAMSGCPAIPTWGWSLVLGFYLLILCLKSIARIWVGMVCVWSEFQCQLAELWV